MNKHIISIAIIAAFAAAPAWATHPGNNGEGNGGCGVGQQTNGCGGGTPSGGQGGAGGNGGAGGQGGAGGSVIGSGNSANHNDNRNTNTNQQGQAQGQLQGQQQGQAQGQIATGGNARSNSGGNTLNNGSSSSSGASSTSSSGGNTLTGGTQSATQANAVTVSGDTVTYQAQQRDPVASAWAAPLAASNGTCMGSTSAGAQGVTIGVSFGTTWTDSGCDARYDAIALQQIGERAAARARLCLKPEIAEAFKRSGHPCADAGKADADKPTAAADAPTVASAQPSPFIN